MTDHPHDQPDDRAVSTVPLETEDGGEVVISQQAQGESRIVGGGEHPDAHEPRSVEDAARAQDELERQAPVDSTDEEDRP